MVKSFNRSQTLANPATSTFYFSLQRNMLALILSGVPSGSNERVSANYHSFQSEIVSLEFC